MSLKSKLVKSLNEKDVENIYRSELIKIDDSEITSPYAVDGLLKTKNIRSLLEFKYNEALKNKLSQCNVLIQCLYYLKKFENNGDKLPTTIFVGDINECFAIHTNSIVKYLASEIDWKIAPSEAHKKNPQLIQAMVGDENILPFVYDVDENFSIGTVIDKIKDFSDNVVRKVRVTKHNIVAIFEYFNKNMFGKVTLTTNEKANLFIQLIINPNENYLHPRRKNILITKSFGELSVNHNLFNSFFSHFEGDLYLPKEKEQLTSLVDRLVDDSVRRNKGEFFTPTPFVDLAHKYVSDTFGEDWKERFVVWDSAWGTGNLTRDYKFKELYCSTLEQSDIDTANQMGYNNEAVKFQYDFLNDGDEKLPQGLQDAINNGKEILFIINPPYATENNLENISTEEKSVKNGIQDNKTNTLMNDEGCWGKSSKNLYTQFLYKITKFQDKNKNIKIGVFSPPLFLSGQSFKEFRKNFLSVFTYKKGFLFKANHFSDVAKDWGISFCIFNGGENKLNIFELNIVDFTDNFELSEINTKNIQSTDNILSGRDWVYNVKNPNSEIIEVITLKSSLSVKDIGGIEENYIGSFLNSGNNIYYNQRECFIGSTRLMSGNNRSNTIYMDNFYKTLSLFTARKSITPNWINCKDEYLAPNEQHPDYEQFTYDSIVYSLFNNSSQQSSLRQVDYKNKKWDIKNEFFWISKNGIQELANNTSYDEIYKDARTSDERFVYKKLFQEGIYDKLTPDAKDVLDTATELVKKSFEMRKLISENHPEYHLDSWDAGYAQLKLVWKEYFKDEFKVFRDKYKLLEDRMRPLVYELGFLRK